MEGEVHLYLGLIYSNVKHEFIAILLIEGCSPIMFKVHTDQLVTSRLTCLQP